MTDTLTPRERANGLLDLAGRAPQLADTAIDAILTVLLPHTTPEDQAALLYQVRNLLEMEAVETAGGLALAGEWHTEAVHVARRAVAADDLASEVAR